MLTWKGEVAVEVMRDGQVVHRDHFSNLITDVGLDHMADIFAGVLVASSQRIMYMALGTDDTAEAAAQTTLLAEVFRVAVTPVRGGTGVVSTAAVVPETSGPFAIRELGWFTGPGASAAPNSGRMVARTLFSYDKSNVETLRITRTDTIGRA